MLIIGDLVEGKMFMKKKEEKKKERKKRRKQTWNGKLGWLIVKEKKGGKEVSGGAWGYVHFFFSFFFGTTTKCLVDCFFRHTRTNQVRDEKSSVSTTAQKKGMHWHMADAAVA